MCLFQSAMMRTSASTSPGATTTEKGTSDGAAEEYAAFVAELLASQEARKSSIEQRGVAVITTSGALVTALFALVALLTKSNGYTLPKSAHGWLGIALVLFAAAGVLALLTNLPLNYASVSADDVLGRAKSHWGWPSTKALRELTSTRADLLRRASRLNSCKAWLLLAAMLAEVTAVICVAYAVGLILRAS